MRKALLTVYILQINGIVPRANSQRPENAVGMGELSESGYVAAF